MPDGTFDLGRHRERTLPDAQRPGAVPPREPYCSLRQGNRECSECEFKTGAALLDPKELRTGSIVPITDLIAQQNGTIAFIRGDCKVVQRLSDLGLTLGTTVSVTRRAPMNGPVEVFVRRTKLAIDHAIAEKIFVDVRKGGEA